MENVHEVDADNFDRVFSNMIMFQRVHNELRQDFQMIYNIVMNKINDGEPLVKPLVRACVKELFTLMEADIFLLNQFNPYPGFDDKKDFITKFKKTFKHHAATFNKQERYIEFISSTFPLIHVQKERRDNFTHPKGRDSINIEPGVLQDIFELYEKYNGFISKMMADVFISPVKK